MKKRRLRLRVPEAPQVPDGFYLHGTKWDSQEHYEAWCETHGFSTNANKSATQLRVELAEAKTSQYESTLYKYKDKQKKKKEESLRKLIKQQKGLGNVSSFERLVAVAKSSKILDETEYVSGLGHAARFQAKWVRQPETWEPKSHNVERQFYSLLDHLFCEYKVPGFMYSAWTKCTTYGNNQHPKADLQKKWFIHLGQGGSARKLENNPIPNFTKKMAHLFTQAPSNYDVNSALRWAQIMGLGGDERLVEAAIRTRYGHTFKQDEFWITVLHMFINHPMLDRAQLGPFVDYITNQKFENQRVWEGGVLVDQPPPQPNFTMKGRTPDALLRQVEDWHGILARDNRRKSYSWDPHKLIKPYDVVEGSAERQNQKHWQIRELLSSKQLSAEGRAMNHCVGSYASSCAKGRISIWSMTCDTKEGSQRCVTIEVNNQMKKVVQVRGKRNRLPNSVETRVLAQWCAAQGLTTRY